MIWTVLLVLLLTGLVWLTLHREWARIERERIAVAAAWAEWFELQQAMIELRVAARAAGQSMQRFATLLGGITKA